MLMSMAQQTLYDVLGVPSDCSEKEIRNAYKKLAKKWHPDKWSTDPSVAEEAKCKFQQIQEAYSVLSNGSKRASYDAGVYDEEDDGFCDFLDEMSAMMASVRNQNNQVQTMEELQQAFAKMVDETWFFQGQANEVSYTSNTSEASMFGVVDDFCYHGQEMDYEYWDGSQCNDRFYAALQDCINVYSSDLQEQDCIDVYSRDLQEFMLHESNKNQKLFPESMTSSLISYNTSTATAGPFSAAASPL